MFLSKIDYYSSTVTDEITKTVGKLMEKKSHVLLHMQILSYTVQMFICKLVSITLF